MKTVVFGATGTIGKLAVKELLAEGHSVTAVARSPEKLGINHPQLTLFGADAEKQQEVADAVKGQDAVVIVVGAGRSRSSLIRSRATLNVIRAMQHHGVRRLICQSTLGAHESWENLNFFWKRIMFGALLRPVFLDHQRQEDMVRASGLDWTIVRPSAFTDGPATGRFQEGFGAEVKGLSLKIARSDVARFLTRQITDRSYIGRAVAISN